VSPHRRAVLTGVAASVIAAPALAATPTLIAEIPGPLLVEGIAVMAERIFVGAVQGRTLLVRDRGQAIFRPFTAEPLLGVYGLAADPRRNAVWAATASPPPTRGVIASELVGLDAATGRVFARFPLPEGPSHRQLGDLIIAANGTIYASDSRGGAILVLYPGATALQTLVKPGIIRSPQAFALLGEQLVVADYSTGLKRIDRRNGAVETFPGGDLRGVDGLCRWKAKLVAIQNGGAKPRIVRMDLAEAQQEVVGAEVLVEGQPLTEPTLGQVVGDDLYFVGRSQWDDFDDDGRPKAGIGPTRIMRLALA
jgi:hypothetical protein